MMLHRPVSANNAPSGLVLIQTSWPIIYHINYGNHERSKDLLRYIIYNIYIYIYVYKRVHRRYRYHFKRFFHGIQPKHTIPNS